MSSIQIQADVRKTNAKLDELEEKVMELKALVDVFIAASKMPQQNQRNNKKGKSH